MKLSLLFFSIILGLIYIVSIENSEENPRQIVDQMYQSMAQRKYKDLELLITSEAFYSYGLNYSYLSLIPKDITIRIIRDSFVTSRKCIVFYYEISPKLNTKKQVMIDVLFQNNHWKVDPFTRRKCIY